MGLGNTTRISISKFEFSRCLLPAFREFVSNIVLLCRFVLAAIYIRGRHFKRSEAFKCAQKIESKSKESSVRNNYSTTFECETVESILSSTKSFPKNSQFSRRFVGMFSAIYEFITFVYILFNFAIVSSYSLVIILSFPSKIMF